MTFSRNSADCTWSNAKWSIDTGRMETRLTLQHSSMNKFAYLRYLRTLGRMRHFAKGLRNPWLRYWVAQGRMEAFVLMAKACMHQTCTWMNHDESRELKECIPPTSLLCSETYCETSFSWVPSWKVTLYSKHLPDICGMFNRPQWHFQGMLATAMSSSTIWADSLATTSLVNNISFSQLMHQLLKGVDLRLGLIPELQWLQNKYYRG
jgi:hypothetical protein